jgi:hypothetical protein
VPTPGGACHGGGRNNVKIAGDDTLRSAAERFLVTVEQMVGVIPRRSKDTSGRSGTLTVEEINADRRPSQKMTTRPPWISRRWA